ncbi:hypothetical protein XV92_08845 [Vibrio metoecus]|uniref:Uncharacterized protein n=1 Tax=Vibrio metoecus TaxID=1481663 RepID=A0A0Q0Q701_VIBMT|nr:oligosaccharide flippase family protein [Vibrio metoecus]KQB01576.1 hypothetical protein XV92_08845 [Vibrio metoecus]
MIKRFVLSGGIQALGIGLSALTTIFISRVLGAEDYGIIGYLTSLTVLFALPSFAGLPQFLVREISKNMGAKRFKKARSLISWSFWYVVGLSSLGIIGYVIYLNYTASDKFNKDIILFSTSLILLRPLLYRTVAILNGVKLNYLSQSIETVLFPLLVMSFCFVHLQYFEEIKALNVVQYQVISLTIIVITSNFYINNYFRVAKFPIKNNKTDWLKGMLPFIAIGIVSGVNSELATVIVGLTQESADVAYLKIATQVGMLAIVSLKIINIITAPTLANLFNDENNFQAQNVLKKSVRLVSLTTFPVIVFIFFYSHEFVEFMFGEEYVNASVLIKILCIGYLFDVLSGQVGTVLIMSGLESYSMYGVLFSMVLNLILLVVLTPIYGVFGSAIALMVTMICWNILANVIIYKKLKIKCWVH